HGIAGAADREYDRCCDQRSKRYELPFLHKSMRLVSSPHGRVPIWVLWMRFFSEDSVTMVVTQPNQNVQA
ncbi:MAG: hypothetical protein ACIAQF_11070, partial [Phycisphaerales bacterium JB065]